jgi:K(+)-stimulated pyrophosphate-energized sodium pump
VIAPILGGHSSDETQLALNTTQAKEISVEKEVKVRMEKTGEKAYTAFVTIVTFKNGEELVEEKSFEGTEAEVKAQIEALKEEGVDVKVKTKKIVKEIVEEVEETK